MNMVTSHSLAGWLVLFLVTRTCPPVLRGRQTTVPSTLGDSEWGSTSPLEGLFTSMCVSSSFGWPGKLGEPLREDTLTFQSCVFAKGDWVHSFGGLLTWW